MKKMKKSLCALGLSFCMMFSNLYICQVPIFAESNITIDADGVLTKYSGNQEIVEIPNTVTAIGEGAFGSNTSVKEVIIPDSVESIGNNAFNNCRSLSKVTIADSVTDIGISAFEGCSSLKEVNLPKELVKFGERAFANCKELENIEIPKSLEDVYDTWDNLYTPEGVFSGCSNLKEVTGSDFLFSSEMKIQALP